MPEMVAPRASRFLPQARRIVGSGDENGGGPITVIGYPRDFHVNYAPLNGFLSNVFYSFQNLGKALQTLSLKRSSHKTFLIPKFVIDTIN